MSGTNAADDGLARSSYRLRVGDAPLGAQMLLVAFGALVLVPILTGLDPNVALFTAGAGTLLFQLITAGKVPVFLASSFAFIAPIQISVQQYGMAATLSGLMAAGLLYVLLAALIRVRGTDMLLRILPAIVTGPVIMVIGLILAPVAVSMATTGAEDGSYSALTAGIVAAVALAATLATMLTGPRRLRLFPILAGIFAGYLVALPLGMVDLTPVVEAPWFAVPSFTAPAWSWGAILFILPVAIAPAIEHFGDVLAIGSVTGRNYLDDPGVDRTMLGDGLATMLASGLGGPPNTTYSEVTGAVTVTKAFNPAIMTWAALTAVALAFVGKLGALLQTIPAPVMGGILFLLFGSIILVGLGTLARSHADLHAPRTIAVAGIVLVIGVGGVVIELGQFSLQGIALAALAGVALNLVLPREPQAGDHRDDELAAAEEVRRLN